MSSADARQTTVHVHRRRRRSLNTLALQLSALAFAFLLVAILVVTSSRQAFVAQNNNIANQVTSATITLTDNASSTAMFANVTGMMPGVNVDSCITVTYTGDVNPTAVQLYASAVPTGTLAPYLNLTVDMGAATTDAFRDCTSFVATTNVYTGTLSTFASAHTGYTTGVPTWDPAGTGESRTFRFRLQVQDTQAAQGLTSTFGFSWETRTS